MKSLATLAAVLLSVQPAFSAPRSELGALLDKLKVDKYAHTGVWTVVMMDAAAYCSPNDTEVKRLNREIEVAMTRSIYLPEHVKRFKEVRELGNYGKMLIEFVNLELTGGCASSKKMLQGLLSLLERLSQAIPSPSS